VEDLISVKYDGKELLIPYRIYDHVSPDLDLNSLPLEKKVKEYCKYTRHSDGHIREKYIEKLINLEPKVAIPYAIQLASEYVLEIIEVIFKQFNKLDRTAVNKYVEENQTYITKSKDRMISYWDCYYMYKCPRLNEYVVFKLFEQLKVPSPNKALKQGASHGTRKSIAPLS